MKVGDISIRRRYSAAQLVVDIVSLAALVYLGYIIYACATDIERLKSLNRTDADMSMFDWRPLIIWAVVAVAVFAASFLLIFRNKKQPKKLFITENNAVKYCNIIDTGVSCVRLMMILLISEVCYIHGGAIRMANVGFSMQLVIDPLIIVCIIILTRMRLTAISDVERERSQKETVKREIVED
ncbi:MAG: hypothetical protein IK093_03275 [Ruminiclostridium sp.]|nr:hypothetical protein [Ruminiclostridium sp.]